MFGCTCGSTFPTVQQLSNHRRSSTRCGIQAPHKRPGLDPPVRLQAGQLPFVAPAGQGAAPFAAGRQDQERFGISVHSDIGAAPSFISVRQLSRFDEAADGYESPAPFSASDSQGNAPLQDESCSSVPAPQVFDASKAMLDFLTNACQGRGFSNSDIDWLLGIIFHPQFERQDLKFRDAKQFRKFQDGLQAIQNAMNALQMDGLEPDERVSDYATTYYQVLSGASGSGGGCFYVLPDFPLDVRS